MTRPCAAGPARLTTLCLALTSALLGLEAGAAQAAGACEARSKPVPPTLVELYTSEGCNSCPPADRWLSSLKGRPDVIAAAFHVDYWDRLGWTDRFGSARHTARQAEQQPGSGARFSYTPQVLANGRDWRAWPGLPAPAAAPSPIQISAERLDERSVRVQVRALSAGLPPRLGLWWALTENDHQSAVRAGENQGVNLHHDHVVRAYQREADWRVAAAPAAPATPAAPVTWAWQLAAPARGEAGRPARLIVVVTDAATQRPLQVLSLGC